MIRAVHVVIPARDEAVLLPRCLTSVERARRVLRTCRPDLLVDVTVVLDSCVDASADVVETARVGSLVVDHGVVGAARHAGVSRAVEAAGALGVSGDDLWIACTDADSLVPPHWLVTQVGLAATRDLVIGTVEPIGLTDAALLERWRERHELVEGHAHVHGANLGFRASTYLEVGGFEPVSLHEDVDLVRRIRAHTPRWVATDSVRVATSARSHGRSTGGFAGFLAGLGEEVG
ncbi:glycosyltransferase [Knoellia locipacati]|uniref:glycosyltransferase n=1 Tax=Knoellia locipacati TaxID=882824 RepID=UPI00384CA99F